MQIWMFNAASTPQTFYFCEDPSLSLRACAPSNFKIVPAHEAQESPLFRATSPAFFDRLNLKHAISFDVRRLWLTTDLATEYMLKHAATLIWSGTLNFKSSYTGAVTGNSIATAVVKSAPGSQMGATTLHSYEIACGALTITGP